MNHSLRPASARATPGLRWVLAVALLLLLYSQLLLSARCKSPTIDEPNHLTRGYAYLETGDLRLSKVAGHPPLFNMLCALPPFMLEDLSFPTHLRSWQIGFRNEFAIEFIFSGAVPLERLFFLGRLPAILTTLCLAALVARWAGELYGPEARLASLFLCALDPNLIAHGQLVTTDIGITFFLFLSVYLFWRCLRRPSPARLVLAGLSLGLAQSVKFSAIIILPMMGLLGLTELTNAQGHLRSHGRSPLSGLLRLAVLMSLVLLLAAVVIWAVYGFQVGSVDGWPIRVPAPIYLEGLTQTLFHASSTGHPAFLLGQRSTKGWWYYFPVAFALKTPLPALAALIWAWASNAWRRPCRAEWPLLLVPALYFALSMGSVLNIGYRHLLPILPFLWTYVGRVIPQSGGGPRLRRQGWARLSMAVLALWLGVGTLRLAPNYLAFFNELAGGPDGGWRYLVDSNLDWGQELPSIKAYLDREEPARVHLSWFGSTYPHLYGLDLAYRLLPGHYSYPYPEDAANSPYNPVHPSPGLYLIGATNLQGVGLAAGDVFASFRERQPVARIGHSVMVYEVADSADAAYPTCISGLRFKDLDGETTSLSLGRGGGAVKWFDHTTSFIVPGQGDVAYVLPSLPLGFAPRWQEGWEAQTQLVYTQEKAARYPAAAVYYLDRASAQAWRDQILQQIATAPMHWSSALTFGASTEIHPINAPARWDYGLELLGYQLLSESPLKSGEQLALATVWRATAEMPPAATDLRVFVHLLDDQSRVWAAEDRLDLDPPTWEPDDLLIQYHQLPLAVDAPPGVYQLEVGLYTSIRMQRLALYDLDAAVSDRLLLQPIEVSAP